MTKNGGYKETDDRVYQRRDGTRYVKSEEFARSEAGRELLERFSENIEVDEDK